MKIWTLWEKGNDDEMPWLVNSYDEYTLDANGEVPVSYQSELDRNPLRRELVLDIPEGVVLGLFKPPVIRVATWVTAEAAEASRRAQQKKDEDDGA